MSVRARLRRRAVSSALRRYAGAAAFAVAAAACGGDDDKDPTSPSEEVQLSSGVSVTGISGRVDSERYYRITVPAGAIRLAVTTTGGSGDVDMGVRRAARPTFDVADCFSEGDTNAESCVIDNPEAGTWYVGLYGFESYSGVTLTATVSTPTRR